MTQAKDNLLTRLHKAQEAANPVAKQGENTQQHYKYARAEDVINEARKALHSASLVATMSFENVEEREVTSNQGTAGLYVTLSAALRIADPDTGEVLEVPGFGSGIDYPGDKAVYKAMTGAAKYAYASALGIPFGDDPENETQDNSRKPGTKSVSGEATPNQKRAMTNAFKRLQFTPELTEQIKDKLKARTKAGASQILDIVFDDEKDDTTKRRELLDLADLSEPTDLPAPDTTDLPPADEDRSEETGTLV